jgi:hypothetical protein
MTGVSVRLTPKLSDFITYFMGKNANVRGDCHIGASSAGSKNKSVACAKLPAGSTIMHGRSMIAFPDAFSMS